MGLGAALLDGAPVPLVDASLHITDDGASRGDGAFESVGVWDGRAFRLRDHIARLNRSLSGILLPHADPDLLEAEAAELLAGVGGDAMLRIYVTAGGTRVLYIAEQPPRRTPTRLIPVPAPWIRPISTFGPAGCKTMSYAFNMAATRAAVASGGDDALLVSLEGWVLEGPTFAVYWVAGGRLHVPPADLGIVASVSRMAVLELAEEAGLAVVVEPRPLDHLLAADEVMVSSAVRPLVAVDRVGDRSYDGPTPLRDLLAAALDAVRRSG